jgi:hypothetical protein
MQAVDSPDSPSTSIVPLTKLDLAGQDFIYPLRVDHCPLSRSVPLLIGSLAGAVPVFRISPNDLLPCLISSYLPFIQREPWLKIIWHHNDNMRDGRIRQPSTHFAPMNLGEYQYVSPRVTQE